MDNYNNGETKKKKYIDFLLEWNQKINLVSKKIGREEISVLIDESLLLGKRIQSKTVIDAGSGNGILGIPISLYWPEKIIIAVEPIRKKAQFLQSLVQYLSLENIEIVHSSIQDFIRKKPEKNCALIARGFPNIEFLFKLVQKEKVRELLLITTESKIKNVSVPMENIIQNYYNIPWRNKLTIVKMENVSRETSVK